MTKKQETRNKKQETRNKICYDCGFPFSSFLFFSFQPRRYDVTLRKERLGCQVSAQLVPLGGRGFSFGEIPAWLPFPKWPSWTLRKSQYRITACLGSSMEPMLASLLVLISLSLSFSLPLSLSCLLGLCPDTFFHLLMLRGHELRGFLIWPGFSNLEDFLKKLCGKKRKERRKGGKELRSKVGKERRKEGGKEEREEWRRDGCGS